MTPKEEEARRVLRHSLELFVAIRTFLEVAYILLPDPPDAEAMGEGLIPESLTYALRGTIEVVQADNIKPAIFTLRMALKETPERLIREWMKRRPAGGEN